MMYFDFLFKKILCLYVFLGVLVCYSYAMAQVVTKQLSDEETKTHFTDQVKKELAIHYPIFRVYSYSDASGEYRVVLAENPSKTEDGKEASDKVQEVLVKYKNGKYTKIAETSDQIRTDQDESSVWFWTKYIALDDYDNDKIADPIIAFGTSGLNGFDDGRITFIIHHKDKKVMLYHQNGVLDYDRNTKVDAIFYELPKQIQNKVKEIMTAMEDKGQAIFPAGWKEAMTTKKTYFDEN